MTFRQSVWKFWNIAKTLAVFALHTTLFCAGVRLLEVRFGALPAPVWALVGMALALALWPLEARAKKALEARRELARALPCTVRSASLRPSTRAPS